MVTERTTTPLEEYQAKLANCRVRSVGASGLYLDCSPMGSGKSYAELSALQRVSRSLTVLASHENCRETVGLYKQHGLNAAAYPRLGTTNCQDLETAEHALKHGLSPSHSVCLNCTYRGRCGYQRQMTAAAKANHGVCTHKRAELSIEALATGRSYITIHEDPAQLLRPMLAVSHAVGMRQVAEIAREASKDLADQMENERFFFWQMEKAARELARHFEIATVTVPFDLPTPADRPEHLDLLLWRAMDATGISPPGEAVSLVKALAAGDIAGLFLQVDNVFARGGQDRKNTKKAIVAFKQTKLPENATIWFCDATADAGEIEALAGRHAQDWTPNGSLAQMHPTVQIPVDITKNASPERVVRTVRTVLTVFAQYQQVGIITHHAHIPILLGTAHSGEKLDDQFRRRIAKTGHFRSGSSRGSNSWHRVCDLLVVLGTPRVPPHAIRTRLLTAGRIQAGKRTEDEVEWGRDYWSAVTVTGRRKTITSAGYRDHDWHTAYRATVAAELHQAIGRGRGIRPDGIPVVVVTTEPLGFQILDLDKLLTKDDFEVLTLLLRETTGNLSDIPPTGELTDAPAKKNIVGGASDNRLAPVSTATIAGHLGKSARQTQRLLNNLLDAGLVERIGQRSGWIPKRNDS